jgi:3-deoxy-7-phosphoheptulonate synthase
LSEQAQTRYIERQKRWYNLSTHMPWIGMRTANIDGAHIEYFRGISNPIGVKVGAAMSAEWLQGAGAGSQSAEPAGRLTFIHRFGIKDIEQRLPDMIRAVRATGSSGALGLRPHARQYRNHGGRRQDAALRQHPRRSGGRVSHSRGEGSMLGGVHIELTGEDVTECIGGARGLTEADLARSYKSQCRSAPERRAGLGAGHADCPPRAGPARVGETPKDLSEAKKL